MNNDLHNIDDLLKGRIEGHEEAVPDSVWDAVNNGLDKKQASYYKVRYQQLKWVAALLLLVCFSGGGYFVYEGLKKSDAPAAKNHETKLITEPNTSVEKKNQGGNDVTTFNNKTAPENSNTSTQEETPLNKTNLDSTNPLSSPKQIQKPTTAPEKNSTLDNSSLVSNSPQSSITSKQFIVAATPVSKSKDKQEKNLNVATNSSSGSPLVFTPFLQMLSPIGKGFSASLLQLPVSNGNTSFNLLAAPRLIKVKTNSARGLSLTAFAAPNVNFNRLKDDHNFGGPRPDPREEHRQEQDAFSMSGGLLLTYGVLKNLSVQSGVTITSSSTAVDARTVYATPDSRGRTRYELHCSSGYVYLSPRDGRQPAIGDSAKTSGTKTSITYVTIPAAVSYRLASGRFSFNPSLGVGLNILTGSKASTNLAGAATKEIATSHISGLKPTYLDGQIGLGVEYGLSKNLSVGLRPNMRLALTPINQQTPLKSYQNFLSVETGVRIKL